jgi:hypothetical protein
LLPQPVWQLVRRVSAFTMRDQNHRTADAHRRAWGEIRRLALAAKAQMDAFLFQTVVLTPERLDIRLHQHAAHLGWCAVRPKSFLLGELSSRSRRCPVKSWRQEGHRHSPNRP